MGALGELVARLAIPGLPDWSGLVALLLLLLTGLAYLLMPFAVFGLKGRLEGLEAQLDEIQAELRAVSLRLTEPPRRPAAAEDWTELPGRARLDDVAPRPNPPVPPPAAWPDRGSRSEPRFEAPRRG